MQSASSFFTKDGNENNYSDIEYVKELKGVK